MLFEIKNRWNGSVIFALECGSLKLCVEAAVGQGANLYGANLSGANLTFIRDDFWAVLCASPGEVTGLRAALVDGRVNGS